MGNPIFAEASASKTTSAKAAAGKYFKYAIGEILLVVVGILLALQVNNWNQNRVNSQKEKSILASLHKEFVENKSQFDTVMFYHKRAHRSAKTLEKMFPIQLNEQTLDSVKKHLGFLLYTYTYNPSQGSINGIINTSSFNIISNDELRGLLVAWQDLVLDFQEDELNTKKVVADLIDPYLSDHVDFDFNFNDKRNNLKVFEGLKFEYLVKLRSTTLGDIFRYNAEYYRLEKSLNKIIELTDPKQ